MWYINSSKSNLKQIDSMIASAYKIALGLPKNFSNKVCWKYSNQPSFTCRVMQSCDRYLCRSFQLGKDRIINKIKFVCDALNSGKLSPRNTPFILSRWDVVRPRLKGIFKSKIHPFFAFPFRKNYIITEFDLISGWKARESREPNNDFIKFIYEKKISLEEIEIYTDGSRSLSLDENENHVGCAIYVPNINKSFLFKLNPITSSFSAEALAIDKALEMVKTYSWLRVNICSDSLSVLQAIKNSEFELFPRALNKLNVVLAELIHKVSLLNAEEPRVRFTWCPAHVGIQFNEIVDTLAKEAAIRGKAWGNNISYKEIIRSLNSEYLDVNNKFYGSEGLLVGTYYFNNFGDLGIKYVRRISDRREDCKILTRLITGYAMTKVYLYKMKVVDSPGCSCGEEFQSLNHIFWAFLS